jgi:hypothetical protein
MLGSVGVSTVIYEEDYVSRSNGTDDSILRKAGIKLIQMKRSE